jgi:DNA-binding transcriptional LysR family regulator
MRKYKAYQVSMTKEFFYMVRERCGFVPNGLSMYVSYPKARATDPQVVAFRDWLLEVGRALPSADGLR